LKDRGIHAVTGRLIGDDNSFVDGDVSLGWTWDDLYASYAAQVSGLQFNQNTARVAVTPGKIGDAPTIDVVPETAPVVLRNNAQTVREPGERLVLTGEPRSTVVELNGTVSPGPRRFIRNIAVANPTLYFVKAMHSALARSGIEIRGGATDIDDVAEPLDRTGAVDITELFATTLAGVAEPMMKNSQNMYAETLFRTLGRETGQPASAVSAERVVSDVLKSWGLNANDIHLVDGSGLSRYDLITPDALSAVLARVWDDERLREQFVRTLPVAGVDGTLSRRMVGTAAEDNARAKTGSFSNARGAAGFVQSADGEPLAFVIFANNYNDEPARIDQVTDRIIVALAEFRRASR
jgi:serine-type D-Ala-D-Ala carboxypeptidase/endopeptidase (penicillin-binding protein 4)